MTDDADGSHFNAQELADIDAVIFSNTSGDAILDVGQRAAFEDWVADGGSVLGIHAATDTYRHSTANGGNTGQWDFYAELIGASVQQDPNHVAGTPLYALWHIGSHPSTAALPDPWEKNEEYYYWESGYYRADNIAVLEVEGTIGPNGEMNSYDAPRPMSWHREPPTGGRVFYTALGHAVANYTDDPLFRAHLETALAWLLEGTADVAEPAGDLRGLFPNPADASITLELGSTGTYRASLDDMTGRTVRTWTIAGPSATVDVSGLAAGTYVLRVGQRIRARLLVQH